MDANTMIEKLALSFLDRVNAHTDAFRDVYHAGENPAPTEEGGIEEALAAAILVLENSKATDQTLPGDPASAAEVLQIFAGCLTEHTMGVVMEGGGKRGGDIPIKLQDSRGALTERNGRDDDQDSLPT